MDKVRFQVKVKESESKMIDWLIKKVIVGKVNGLLKDYQGKVDKVKTILKRWIARLQKILDCCEKLLAKIDDGEISAEEVNEAAEDITQVVKEW